MLVLTVSTPGIFVEVEWIGLFITEIQNHNLVAQSHLCIDIITGVNDIGR